MSRAKARVVAVQDDLVTIESTEPVMKNEIIYVRPTGTDEQLRAEVLRVQGRRADAQVFEETRGVGIGDEVTLSGELLSVELGPGLLGGVFDGLQTPLSAVASDHGFFLPRGIAYPPLDREKKWSFTPSVTPGAELYPGDVLGTVDEGQIAHRILVPMSLEGPLEVRWLEAGTFTVSDTVATLSDASGAEHGVSLLQRWPVRRPFSEPLLRQRLSERLYPNEPLTTTQRIIDVFFPIALGGTACIPGPFGAGKTVLQHMLARHSAVDIVIVIACGERAGEVVETITEFPELKDPRSGGSLMERTIIICNTSSMPVAAREASIYTGISLGEYYRQMGYHVLCLADSTSRWAQAMRELSGRLEEIPGEEAFPANLDSTIKGVYERAGVTRSREGRVGSMTLIVSVSPAGGDFEEPVTQATLGTVKTFLGLSSDRAYKRFYPAIEPLISWSRYLEQLTPWFDANLGADWVPAVHRLMRLLARGNEIEQMLQVTGDEGISPADYATYQKALFVDLVFLQQDAFDEVDASMSRERQIESFRLMLDIVDTEYHLPSQDDARRFFTELTRLYKNLNYAAAGTPAYDRWRDELRATALRHLPDREAAG